MQTATYVTMWISNRERGWVFSEVVLGKLDMAKWGMVMAFVHPNSVECTKSELDLFSVPSTQVSLERGKWVDDEPVSSVGDGVYHIFVSWH